MIEPGLTPFAAVVLAGGRGSRLGGFDKAGIEVRGRTLLEHALDAVVDAAEVVVVGPAGADRPPGDVRRRGPPGSAGRSPAC
ncbi:NTP transferase domain-containing protein [Nocardioides sp. TF02-7]|uniref:NTP transferase domain-containing protein n=1 Tax=Nocardioides sp. TF02-7 TaxID=2917724 RepID=UPI0023DC3FB0|nr:NTP transferase domain-containing protein [Nocardioides sp. TF02-7]